MPHTSNDIRRSANQGSRRVRENGPKSTEKKDAKKVVKAVKGKMLKAKDLAVAKKEALKASHAARLEKRNQEAVKLQQRRQMKIPAVRSSQEKKN